MTLRATMMGRMTPMDDSPALQESENMTRKLILLALLVGTAALLLSILFKLQSGLPLLLSTFFADTSLGLVAGFGSRSLLQKWNLYIRSLVAILLAFLGMLMLGYLTQSVLGIGPFALDSRLMNQIHKITLDRNVFDQIQALKIDWRELIDLSKLNWADPVHLALSMLMAGLSLDAWSNTTAIPQPIERTPLPSAAAVAPSPRRRSRASSAPSNGQARVHLPGNWLARLKPSPAPQRRARSNGRSRPVVQTAAKVLKEPVVHAKRRRSRRKPKIQFALVEEHRCPYCLDAVTHNDPRGVTECEVCHSLHHADCWAITGVCQVPHLNT